MRWKTYRGHMATMCMVSCAVLLSACGNSSGDSGDKKTSDSEQSKYVLTFVAADKTNWDKEVTFGDYDYTLAVNLEEDNTLKLLGTCVGQAEPEAEAQGGMPDFGKQGSDEDKDGPGQEGQDPEGQNPEGQAPEGQNPEGQNPEGKAPEGEDSDKKAPEKDAQEDKAMSESEMDEKDFEIDGTWSYEEGWGYTLVFEDGSDTTITADFDKASSRQYFYYDMVPDIEGQDVKPVQVQFQAEDRKFRSEMADDYVISEERNAKYYFKGSGKTGMGNATSISVYCEEDGTVAVVSLSGSTTTYSRGTWSEDEASHQLNLMVGDTDISADYCDVAGKEGYRINYEVSGMGGSTSVVCYAPVAEGMKSEDYKAEDFEGAVTHTLTCPEGDYTIELTEKGFLNVYSEGTPVESSVYSYDEAGDVYTMTLGGTEVKTAKNGNAYTVTGSFTKSNGMPMGGEAVPDTRTFTFQ